MEGGSASGKKVKERQIAEGVEERRVRERERKGGREGSNAVRGKEGKGD